MRDEPLRPQVPPRTEFGLALEKAFNRGDEPRLSHAERNALTDTALLLGHEYHPARLMRLLGLFVRMWGAEVVSHEPVKEEPDDDRDTGS